MKCVGIIPARWQSSRFPGKPLSLIDGQTLLHRTYHNALACKTIDHLCIATDDRRIYDHARSFQAPVYMTPDCSTGMDRVCLIAQQVFATADIIVNIQGDEPCIDPTVIDSLVDRLRATPDAVMTTPIYLSSSPLDWQDPTQVKCTIDEKGQALDFYRIPTINHADSYYLHIGIYCFRQSFSAIYTQIPPTKLQIERDLEQLKVVESGYPLYISIVDKQIGGVNVPSDIQKIEKSLWQRENIYSLPGG